MYICHIYSHLILVYNLTKQAYLLIDSISLHNLWLL